MAKPPKWNAWDALPPEVRAALEPVNKAVERLSKPPPKTPYLQRPGALGGKIAGPPLPVTIPGSKPDTVPTSEIKHASTTLQTAQTTYKSTVPQVRSTGAAYTSALTAAKRATSAWTEAKAAAAKRYGVNAQGVVTLPYGADEQYRLLNSLQEAANAAVETYNHARNSYKNAYGNYQRADEGRQSALETFGTTIQRAQEYELAQRTHGLFEPTGQELEDYGALQRAAHRAARRAQGIGAPLGDLHRYANTASHFGRRTLATLADLMPAAQAPVAPGEKPKEPLGVKGYDLGGVTIGGAKGLSALGAAAVTQTIPPLVENVGANVQQYLGDVTQGAAIATGGNRAAAKHTAEMVQPETRPASFIPAELVTGALKIAGGGIVAGTSLNPLAALAMGENPITQYERVAREGVQILRGTTQLAGLGIALTDPDTSWAKKYDISVEEIVKPTLQDLKAKYGSDVTIQQLYEGAKKEPLVYGLNAVALISGVSKVLTGLYALKTTATVGEALRAIHTPTNERLLTLRGAPAATIERPDLPRRFGVGSRPPVVDQATGRPFLTPEGGAMQVQVQWPRSPAIRTFVSRPYDQLSRFIESKDKLRRIPVVRLISENSRAARALQRNNDKMRRRLPAWAQGMMRAVEDFLKGQPEMKLALALLLQKPTDFTDEEWLDSILTNLKHMEATGEFIGPEGRLTPAAARLVASIRRNEGRSDAARVKRQGRASRNISIDQLRLGHALDRLAAERSVLLEERRRYAADTEMSTEDKTALISEIDLELRANTAQRDVARQSLQDIQIHLDPVENTPERIAYRDELAKNPNIGGGQATHDLPVPVVRPATTHVVEPDPDAEPPPMMGHQRLYRIEEPDPNGGPSAIRWTDDRDYAESLLDDEEQLQFVDLNTQEAMRLTPPEDGETGYELPPEIANRAEAGNTYQRKLWDEYVALREKPTTRTAAEKRRFKELDKYFRKPRSKAAIEADRDRLIQEAIARREILLGSQEGQLLDDGMAISDIFARRWGQNYNRNPADWYKDAVNLKYSPEGEGIPEDAFFQKRSRKRPPQEGMKTDPKLERGYWNQTHRDLVRDLEREEASLDAMKQRVKDDERKGESDPSKITDKSPEYKEAKDRHDFAKEVELEARVWYGSQTYKGTVTGNPARRILARRLIKEYAGVGKEGREALPSRFRTERGLEHLMSMLDELATQGEHAQLWYENSAKAILRLAHGDKKLAANIAQLVAIYSPQKAVIPNLGEAIKAYASWKSSKPITNGQEWQQKAAQAVLDRTNDWNGRKTNNFFRNFLEDIDPALFKRERAKILADPTTKLKDRKAWEGGVTSDMWMARVFGYTGKIVPDKRYDVIEDVVRQLAKERGWKPKHIQAAIWTAIKDKSDDISANVDFDQAISHHYGQINWTAAPGSTYAGPFAAIYNSWSPETRAAFMAATTAAVDDFLSDAGILFRRNQFGPGGARIRVVTGGRHDADTKEYHVTPDDKALLNFVAASIGRATLQDSVPWARAFDAKAQSHGNGMMLNLGRRLTDEEANRLAAIINTDPANPRVEVVHAGTEGVIIRKTKGQDAWPNSVTRKKPDKDNPDAWIYADTFQGVVESAVEEVFPERPERATLEYHATDGETQSNDWTKGSADYEQAMDSATRDSGDSGEVLRLRKSADRLATETQRIRDEFERDPAGSSLAANDDLGRRDRSAQRRGLNDPRGPPRHALAQTRKEVVLGATEWLETAPGKRIIYLTEQADISTLLHELVGHGAYEMKAFHPQEFVKVEERMGRPIEQWTREDHEQFARWAEQYFVSGEPPTPELVPVMDRLKAWMRAIYAGMNAHLGPKMPTEVRQLFDTFFGAYDDETVFRVAMNLGRAGRGDEHLGLKAQPKRRPGESTEDYARRLLSTGYSVGPATQALIENFAAQERLAAKANIEVPKITRDEAAKLLDQLSKKYDAALEEIAKALFGPVDKAEVAKRNAQRGKDKRIHARSQKSLAIRGMGTSRLKLGKTVKEERLADVQRRIEEAIDKNPDDPTIQHWIRRRDEIERLDKIVNPDPDEVFGLPTPEYKPDPFHSLQRQRIAELDASGASPMDPGYRNMWSSAARLDMWDRGPRPDLASGKHTYREKSINFLERMEKRDRERAGDAPETLPRQRQLQERLFPGVQKLGEPDYAAQMARLEAERSELLKTKLTEDQPNYEDLESYDIQRYGAAMVLDKQALESLKRRQETARARKSVLGMRVELADLEKQLEELKAEPGVDGTPTSAFTKAQERRAADLTARILDERNRLLIREDKREKNLRQKIDLLEKAMSRGFDNRRFQGALYAMQEISKAREQVLRDTFGADFDRVFGKNFEDRRDLLADWLVERGLLRPDFQRGTAHYFPSTVEDASLLPPQTAGQPLTGRVIGSTKTDQLNLYKRNQMILWQQGSWNADPAVLMESYLRALSFSWMNEIKSQLWNLGRRLTLVEAANVPKDVYLINKNGTPISREVRSQLKPGAEHNPDLSANHDPQAVLDAVDGTDNDRLEFSLKNYWNNLALDGNDMPPDYSLLNPDGHPRTEIRVVPKEVVHALLRPLRGGRTGAGKALDIATTMARFSLIYANAPAYMLSNAVGNLGLLLLTEPWQLAKSMGRARKLLGDPLIAFRIYAETGDLPAFAAISRGRAFDLGSVDVSNMARKGEQKWLEGLSVVDKFPRALAWIAEAERLGYRKSDDIIALLDGKTPKTAKDRLTVSEFATNAMIDFNRLRPWEQLYLTRALFIWPFVRGSTAWPFWYAKNYPERTAVIAGFAVTADQRREQMLEPGDEHLPRRQEGLFPISTSGTGKYRTAQVVNGNVVSPTSTLQGELQAGGDIVNYILSALGHGDGNKEPVTALVDMISPVATTILEIATQRNDWGQALSAGEVLGDVGETFMPFVRLYNATAGDNPLWGENRTPRAFLEDAGPGDQARRTFIRIAPQTLTIQWANAQGMKHGDKTATERIEQASNVSQELWHQNHKGEPWPAGAKRAIVMRIMYEERVKEREREKVGRSGMPPFVPTKIKGTTGEYDFHYHATPYERAKIAYAIAKKYMKGADIVSPDSLLVRYNATPTSEMGKDILSDYLADDWGDLLEPETDISSEAADLASQRKYDREKERQKRLGLVDKYNRSIPSKRPLYKPEDIPVG